MADESPQDCTTDCPTVPWWESKTIWWALITAVCNIAGLLGYQVSTADQEKVVEIIVNIGTIATIGLVIWSRVHAKLPISSKLIPDKISISKS